MHHKLGQKPRTRTISKTFLTVTEAAEKLDISARTVTRWCETGRLPAIEKPYGSKVTYLISPQAVELELIRSQSEQEAKKRQKQEAKPHPEYVNAWIAAMAKGLLTGKPYSRVVIEDYRHYIELYFSRSGSISIAGLKAGLARIPAESVSKKQHYHKAVLCFAKFLVSEGILDGAFVNEAKPLAPKYHKPPKRLTVSPEGLEALVKASESVVDETLVLFLANTGLRAMELCNLRMSDIDLENRVLNVRLGKGGKSRRIGLNETALNVLRRYLGEYPTTSNQYIFRDAKGKQLSRSGLYQRLERMGKKAGVAVSSHALRRAFVTINAHNGRPLPLLQLACGHSDIKTTMSYCRISEKEVIDAMQNW